MSLGLPLPPSDVTVKTDDFTTEKFSPGQRVKELTTTQYLSTLPQTESLQT